MTCTCTVVSRKRAHGQCIYLRLRQRGGPTFMTSMLQLYVKVRPGLHTLYSRFRYITCLQVHVALHLQ